MTKEKLVSLKELQLERRAQGKALTLKVSIPAKAVPLFLALAEASQADSKEDFAAYAVCKWIKSEEALQVFDDVVNGLL